MLVVDSSIVLSWILADEASAVTDRLAEAVSLSGAWAPGLLRSEVANVLVMAERRGRISVAEMTSSLVDFDDLAIEFEEGPDPRALRQIVHLARTEALTVYDATYLELALRLAAELLTLDVQLAAAARNLGLKVRP